MTTRQMGELLMLAALWGSSFLFLRVAAPEFGPVALAAVRVTLAAVCLLPLLLWQGQWQDMRRHWRHLLVVGLGNSAVPFICFSYAALSITAGLASIFNATVPLFGALIAWLWLKDRLTAMRSLGLLIGFAGVVYLAWDKASFRPDAQGVSTGWAVLACLVACVMYGWAANYTKRHLTGVPSLTVATGSMVSATLVLALPAALTWPDAMPGAFAWGSVITLALVCTAFAYIVFFHLIGAIGPANAMSVTFLVPVFAVLWGWLFLSETITSVMLIGCAVILVGTALTTGLVGGRRKALAPID